MKYGSRYERLVANTRLAEEGNVHSCWLWNGATTRNGYPLMTERVRGKPQGIRAHRAMLEELLDATFPLDEGGHLCCTPSCIHPSHLEVQTSAFNLGDRRGYAHVQGCMIPVLFPREDLLQAAADRAWDEPGQRGGECPF